MIHYHEQDSDDDMTDKHMSNESIINGGEINRNTYLQRAVETAMEQFATCRNEGVDDLSWACPWCECDLYK